MTASPTDCVYLRGKTTASYFWDDGSGINGDTGAPASGLPMQKGLAASPSWPLGTEGYVTYNGKKATFFVGDRGPGDPSSAGIMLDLDGKTFAQLTGGSWNSSTLTVDGNGGMGHIPVSYVITKWGDGPGNKGKPQPFSTGAYAVYDESSPRCVAQRPAKKAEPKRSESGKAQPEKGQPEKARPKKSQPEATAGGGDRPGTPGATPGETATAGPSPTASATTVATTPAAGQESLHPAAPGGVLAAAMLGALALAQVRRRRDARRGPGTHR